MLKLRKSDLIDFEKIYNDMTVQFPKSELNEFCVYEKLLKKGSYLLFIAEDDGKDVGYSLLFEDKNNNVLWLDYVAVFKEFHSKGYGKRIFECLNESLSQFDGVYLEVEKPDELAPNTIRRIKFYENLGAKNLECVYFYPNSEGSIPLDLYFLPFKNGTLPSRERTRKTVENVFESLHSHHKHVGEVLNKIII